MASLSRIFPLYGANLSELDAQSLNLGLSDQVPETSLSGQVVGYRTWRPSAAWDTSLLGGAAIRSLAGLNNSASLLALSNAQAVKMRRIAQVAMLRGMEAQNVIEFLRKDAEPPIEEVSATGMPATSEAGIKLRFLKHHRWRIATGIGFGLADPEVHQTIQKNAGGGFSLSLPAVPTVPGASTPLQPQVDVYGYRIKNDLQRVVELSQEAVRNSAVLADRMTIATKAANEAARAAAAALQYPGMPPESVPMLSLPTPPKVSRPTQVAPDYLDFLFATDDSVLGHQSLGNMADPYDMPTIDGGRRSVHNPFSPFQPQPAPDVEPDEVNAVAGEETDEVPAEGMMETSIGTGEAADENKLEETEDVAAGMGDEQEQTVSSTDGKVESDAAENIIKVHDVAPLAKGGPVSPEVLVNEKNTASGGRPVQL